MNDQLINQSFWGEINPQYLIEKYGSPLYIYNEKILRQRCREIKKLLPYDWFSTNYSIKANSNLSLLRIIEEEGLHADAMSPGEIFILLKAGFKPSNIFYIGNNVSGQELQYAVDCKVVISIDSVSQLESFGRINPKGKVAVRLNPGIGAGHHEKVVTAGSRTKFGIEIDLIDEIRKIAKNYSLKIIGVNQHIGSLFLDGKPYIECVKTLLKAASCFPELEFVDLGGGFGIPYRKHDGEKRLDFENLSNKLSVIILDWLKEYGREVKIKVEPGRYITAECGALLGTVHAVKMNYGTKYVGTDIGLNVFARPVMYDSYHDVEIFRNGKPVDYRNQEDLQPVTIVGNICESGDIIARDRKLPPVKEGDILSVMDAGAYGYSMCSNYNLRLRPAEVLIKENGEDVLIRRRDTLEDLLANF